MSNQLLDMCSLYEVAEYNSEQLQRLVAEIQSGLARAAWHAGTLSLISRMLTAMQQVYQEGPDGQIVVNEEALREMDEIELLMDTRHFFDACAQRGLLSMGVVLLSRALK
jgi:hypothetical protein